MSYVSSKDVFFQQNKIYQQEDALFIGLFIALVTSIIFIHNFLLPFIKYNSKPISVHIPTLGSIGLSPL